MPDASTCSAPVYGQIEAGAERYRIPAIFPHRYMVTAGGLLSYGTDNADLFRKAASYVDRILKGEKAGDLPVQLPTKFETAVNLKTAKALRITMIELIVLRADEVIE